MNNIPEEYKQTEEGVIPVNFIFMKIINLRRPPQTTRASASRTASARVGGGGSYGWRGRMGGYRNGGRGQKEGKD